MYAFIRGYLAEKDQNSAVIDAGGVGYLLSISYSTYAALPELGEEVKLYSHLSVREDAMELFGFADREELSVFKMLITVSGVGPKAALAILSELSPGRFALAVSAGDVKALTKAAGVGPKLAQRIVLELKDKIAKSGAEIPTGGADFLEAPAGSNAEEAAKALVVLGYSANEARAAVAKCQGDTVEELIRLALKQLM